MIDINPDIEFKKEVKRLSNSSLNECMQCGNCSVVCTLSPDDSPFPRKEMIWAGWGMKEKLIVDTDIWLCHQCGDCSTHCPRGVKPADVFSAIRQITYRHYARPKFLNTILSKPIWLPVAILLPVIVILLILLMAGTLQIPEGVVNYSKFFPHAWLNGSFGIITLIIYCFAISGLLKFRNDLKAGYQDTKSSNGFLKRFIDTSNEIILHSKFSSCSAQKSRKWSHLLVFYGFIMLLFVTGFAIIATLTHNYPLKFTNPVKIMGNVAGLMLVTGLGIMIINRLFNKKNYGNSNYSDWLLLISFFLLVISGGIIELARFMNWYYAYHLYFFHLVCVWFVIFYLPYAKFGHVLYRTIAIGFAKSIDRSSTR